jgi:cytochrome c
MLRHLADQNSFQLDATEDASVFEEKSLRKYDGVVWLSTSGDVLDEAQRQSFEDYIRSGSGFVGIHAAADTESSWPFYRELVGATFRSHPEVHLATIRVEDRKHESMLSLPARWSRTDEWYDYRESPRGRVHVLATVDEASYPGGTMGSDHPIVWCHDKFGGAAWYTGLGHTPESFDEPALRQHVLGGIASVCQTE